MRLAATPRERYLAARSQLLVALGGLALVALCLPFVSIVYAVVRRAGPVAWEALDASSARATVLAALFASAVAVPIGVGAGVYLAEFGVGRFGRAVRASADVAGGMPAIVVAAMVYVLARSGVVGLSPSSGVALALALMMTPRVARTTDEAVRAVPGNLREAALCLGVSRWRTVVFVMLRTASPRIARNVIVAVARVIGEAAPVLVLGATHGLREGQTLPARVAELGASPLGWGTAALLLAVVLSLSLLARAR